MLVFDIGLRTRPFPELQAYAAQPCSRPIQSPEKTGRLIHTLNDAVDHARYNHLYPMTCLRRALTLQKMLAQRGISADLKIGVRKEAGQLSAHAWLEHQGKPIGELKQIKEQYVLMIKGAINSQQS